MKIDDSVYEEGYADALIEMEALACYKCETCDCDGCCIPDDVKGLYQKIRIDAIDECKKVINNVFLYTDKQGIDRYADYYLVNRNSLMNYLEQLKEKKNE